MSTWSELDSPWVPLSIGVVLGGITSATADDELRRLAGCVRRSVEGQALADVEHEASVNVVFHVPGTILKPDYTGIRTSSWRGSRRVQVMQVAVPEDLEGPEGVEFLAAALEEAVELSVPHLARFKRSRGLGTRLARQAAAMAAGDFRSSRA
jgi:hypothetical protein